MNLIGKVVTTTALLAALSANAWANEATPAAADPLHAWKQGNDPALLEAWVNQRLGAVNDGWKVSLTTLMNERLSIGSGMTTGFAELFDLCSRIETPDGLAIDDRAVRAKLATWATLT